VGETRSAALLSAHEKKEKGAASGRPPLINVRCAKGVGVVSDLSGNVLGYYHGTRKGPSYMG